MKDPAGLQVFLAQAPFFDRGRRRPADAALPVPAIDRTAEREMSTQMAFGKILDDLAGATARWRRGSSPPRRM